MLGKAAIIIIIIMKANVGYLIYGRYSCSILIIAHEMGTLSSPTSQIRKPRNREKTSFSQSHTGREWQNRNFRDWALSYSLHDSCLLVLVL